MCVNCCAEGCCNCRIPFYIFPQSDTKGTKDTNVGFITKIWSGLGTELFTDADKFEVCALYFTLIPSALCALSTA